MTEHTERMYTAEQLADLLQLRHRKTGVLCPKRAYDLPIRKTKLPGVGVRWRESDVKLYLNLNAA